MKSPYKFYRKLRLWNEGLGIVHKLILIGSRLGLASIVKHFEA